MRMRESSGSAPSKCVWHAQAAELSFDASAFASHGELPSGVERSMSAAFLSAQAAHGSEIEEGKSGSEMRSAAPAIQGGGPGNQRAACLWLDSNAMRRFRHASPIAGGGGNLCAGH